MRHISFGLLALLGGCWLSDAEVVSRYDSGSVDPDTDVADVATASIVSISPNFGTNSGQQTVVIEVDAVGPDLAVSIGSSPAEVLSVDGTTLTVRTPRGEAGGADVAVSSGGGTGTLPDGYWYWEDAAGAFGTLGDVTYYDYTGDLERLGYLDKTLVNIAVVEGSFEDYSATYGVGLDMCRIGIPGLNPSPLDLQSPDIQLGGDGGSPESVAYDSIAENYVGELSADTMPGVAYSMLPFQGTGPFPAFGIDPIADLPSGFSVDQPDFSSSRLFTESLGDDVAQDAFVVEWTRPDDADYVVLELVRWGPNQTNTEWEVAEVAGCLVVDDGSFQIPGALWTRWDLGAPVDVYLSRTQKTEGVLPHNNSINGVVGRSLVAGTVWQALF